MKFLRAFVVLSLTIAMTAARQSQVPVSPPGFVVFEVTSIPHRYTPGQIRGEPVEFAMHALGANLKRSVDFERKTTPYTVTLKGREVYAMFNQVGGSDILNVEVNPTSNKGCQVTAPISLLIVRGDQCGGTFMDPRLAASAPSTR
jgi:hypothetical protein